MRTIARSFVAITLVALCVALTPALASAQTPQPTPPGPYTVGQCGELAAEPSASFAAPTNLTVRWGSLPDNPQASGALLAWQDNADDETCYVVERRGPGTTEWQQIIYAPFPDRVDSDDRNFVEPGYYCYRVFAGSEAGRSAYSNEACLEVPEATVHGLPPGAPPPPPPPTPPAAVSPMAAAQPAALPVTGGGSPSDNAPSYLLMSSLLAVGGVLASVGLLALAVRRR